MMVTYDHLIFTEPAQDFLLKSGKPGENGFQINKIKKLNKEDPRPTKNTFDGICLIL